jgi:hypothetical protein
VSGGEPLTTNRRESSIMATSQSKHRGLALAAVLIILMIGFAIGRSTQPVPAQAEMTRPTSTGADAVPALATVTIIRGRQIEERPIR